MASLIDDRTIDAEPPVTVTPKIPIEILDQMFGVYRQMADKARYRPGAPSDGMGNITTNEFNFKQEAQVYAAQWWKDEDSAFFFAVGCCDFETRPATVYAIEAARQMCAGRLGNASALRLLKLAVKQLEGIRK